MTGNASFEDVIKFRQDLFQIFGGNDAGEFFRSFMVGYGQVVIGRRKAFWLLTCHRLAMHEEAEMRFGQAFRQLVILYDERIHDHLDCFQMLQHDRAMRLRSR